MALTPGQIKADAPTTEMLVGLLQREATAIQALIGAQDAAGDPARETELAFVCSIAGPLVQWALARLPRIESGSQGSTENERMLLHQLLGTINALADIY